MKPNATVVVVAVMTSATSLTLPAQERTVLEVRITEYRAEIVRYWLDCPDGSEIPAGSQRWVIYGAHVERALSGRYEQEEVWFASQTPLKYECVALAPLPAGRLGESLYKLGAAFEVEPAYCGEFRPRCETDPGSGSTTCYWDDYLLDMRDSAAEITSSEPAEVDTVLLEAFLSERAYSLVDTLDVLPPDVQARLPKWPDGSFAIAEQGESWRQGDWDDPCYPKKRSQHIVSGISDRIAVVFHLTGGIAVLANVRILDRASDEQLICDVDRDAVSDWDGGNHRPEMILRPPEGNECRYVSGNR